MMVTRRFRRRSRARGGYQMLGGLLLLAAAAASILAPPARADSTPTRVVTVPYHVSPFDECTGEFVDLSGTLREVFNTTTDASGGQHRVEIDLYSQLTGTGESSGNSYRFVTASTSVEQQLSSGTLIFSDAGIQVLLSGGSSPNLVHTIDVHFTLSPTGQITNVSNFTFACRG
jgi:hypothetical protein